VQERQLILSYAPAEERSALALLLSLDDLLGVIARTTRDVLIAQMRLTWWYHALVALDTTAPPAEPLLRGLAAELIPRGVSGSDLARLVGGWETLLEDEPSLEVIAEERGAVLFAAAATLLGAPLPSVAAGPGWALSEVAVHSLDPALARRARNDARSRLDRIMDARWPASLRALGALALLARFDVSATPPPVAGPRRTARLAWHRVTGR
jgi:phytoene synthase